MEAALEAALAWHDGLSDRLHLGDGDLTDVWLEEGEVDGYEFVALRSARAIQAEAAAMRHCVSSYVHSLAHNEARLFSVRKDGSRVAALELQPGFPEGPFPTIVELAGVRSAPVAAEVWRAARRWLHAQDDKFDASRLEYRHAEFDPRAWRALWRPFWLAKRAIPSWLPLAPNNALFFDL